MKVLLVATGSRGDTQPMLALGCGLQEAGHEVRLAGSPDFRDWAERLGLTFDDVGRPIQTWLSEYAPNIDKPLALALSLGRDAGPETEAQFDDLEKVFDIFDPDVVIAASVMLAAQSFAQARDLPYRHVAFCPQTIPSTLHPPPVVTWQNHSPTANKFYWWIQRVAFNFLAKRRINRRRKRMGLPRVRSVYDHILDDGVMLACDEVLGAIPNDTDLDVFQSSAWQLGAPETVLPPALKAFLETGDPPVYVGFGSMPDASPRETTALLSEVCQAAGVRMVIMKGWANLGSDELPESVFVTDPIDHRLLFKHMSTIVHHGGAGTTAAASRSGMPQLIVPHLLDQYWWAKHVEALGIAPKSIHRRDLSVQNLAAALVTCRTDEGIKTRARELAAKLSNAQGVPAAVRFVESLAKVS